jgi:hypothetical protein
MEMVVMTLGYFDERDAGVVEENEAAGSVQSA